MYVTPIQYDINGVTMEQVYDFVYHIYQYRASRARTLELHYII